MTILFKTKNPFMLITNLGMSCNKLTVLVYILSTLLLVLVFHFPDQVDDWRYFLFAYVQPCTLQYKELNAHEPESVTVILTDLDEKSLTS